MKKPSSLRPLLVLGLASVLGLAACGGAQAPASTEPAPAGGETPEPTKENLEAQAETPAAAPLVHFEDMKPGEKVEYMKHEVLPKMTKIFQDSGDDDFSQVSCKTCHGSRAGKGDFTMPNEELPVLDFGDGLKDEKAAHPKMTQYMMDVVTPEMAKLLGEEHYDPATGKGFGCTGCHTAKK